MSQSMTTLRKLAPFALISLFVACVEQPGAQRIVGPDGSQLLHVHCGKEQVSCFQLAGERCPHGYDLSPIFDPHDGNFLVRCRSAAPLVVITNSTAPLPPRTASSATAAVSDRWPPAEVARPSEPWPDTSAQPSTPPPAGSAHPVDIGY